MVLILKTGKGKMSPNWDSRIFKVIKQKGAALKLQSDSGELVFRNVTHVRPYFQRQDFRKNTNLESVPNLGVNGQRERRIITLPKKFKD